MELYMFNMKCFQKLENSVIIHSILSIVIRTNAVRTA